jgi:hypothetical protein
VNGRSSSRELLAWPRSKLYDKRATPTKAHLDTCPRNASKSFRAASSSGLRSHLHVQEAVDTRAVPIDEAERVGTAELRSSGIQVQNDLRSVGT